MILKKHKICPFCEELINEDDDICYKCGESDKEFKQGD